ncbi:MAG: hypothetical protein J3K34DRAFT_67056 [Monoraphidium minutum]|nr:MAG: hypothetical protein J3K34DRAFT_67056 [Monoraphidium minutum]
MKPICDLLERQLAPPSAPHGWIPFRVSPTPCTAPVMGGRCASATPFPQSFSRQLDPPGSSSVPVCPPTPHSSLSAPHHLSCSFPCGRRCVAPPAGRRPACKPPQSTANSHRRWNGMHGRLHNRGSPRESSPVLSRSALCVCVCVQPRSKCTRHGPMHALKPSLLAPASLKAEQPLVMPKGGEGARPRRALRCGAGGGGQRGSGAQ